MNGQNLIQRKIDNCIVQCTHPGRRGCLLTKQRYYHYHNSLLFGLARTSHGQPRASVHTPSTCLNARVARDAVLPADRTVLCDSAVYGGQVHSRLPLWRRRRRRKERDEEGSRHQTARGVVYPAEWTQTGGEERNCCLCAIWMDKVGQCLSDHESGVFMQTWQDKTTAAYASDVMGKRLWNPVSLSGLYYGHLYLPVPGLNSPLWLCGADLLVHLIH